MLLRSGKGYIWDFLLSLLAMMALASGTGFFAMFLSVMLNFIVARQRLILLLVTAVLSTAFLSMMYLFFQNTDYYRLFGGFLLNSDGPMAVLDMVLGRSGNRWIRAVVGWEAFLRHPWLGVGIGGDAAYMGASPFPDSVAGYLRPYMDLDRGQGQPFINILIEIMGTMGIVGLLPFLGILSYAIYAFVKTVRGQQTEASAFFMAFFRNFPYASIRRHFLALLSLGTAWLGPGHSGSDQRTARRKTCSGAGPARSPYLNFFLVKP